MNMILIMMRILNYNFDDGSDDNDDENDDL